MPPARLGDEENGGSQIARQHGRGSGTEGPLDAAARRRKPALVLRCPSRSWGPFEWDLLSNSVICDERSREIFGFGPTEGCTISEVSARIHPHDFPEYSGIDIRPVKI